MALETWTKKLAMVPPLGGTTQSSIDVTQPTKSGSKHDDDNSRRNSVGSSGKASRCIAHWQITLWPLVP
jgi:hypothetical protein